MVTSFFEILISIPLTNKMEIPGKWTSLGSDSANPFRGIKHCQYLKGLWSPVFLKPQMFFPWLIQRKGYQVEPIVICISRLSPGE